MNLIFSLKKITGLKRFFWIMQLFEPLIIYPVELPTLCSTKGFLWACTPKLLKKGFICKNWQYATKRWFSFSVFRCRCRLNYSFSIPVELLMFEFRINVLFNKYNLTLTPIDWFTLWLWCIFSALVLPFWIYFFPRATLKGPKRSFVVVGGIMSKKRYKSNKKR